MGYDNGLQTSFSVSWSRRSIFFPSFSFLEAARHCDIRSVIVMAYQGWDWEIVTWIDTHAGGTGDCVEVNTWCGGPRLMYDLFSFVLL